MARYRDRVVVTEQDGLECVRQHVDDPAAFMYVDPPYLSKSDDLYLNTLEWVDHERLAAVLNHGGQWLVTYDVDDRVAQLYPDQRRGTFQIKHTAGVQHVGTEYVVFAPSLEVPVGTPFSHFLAYV